MQSHLARVTRSGLGRVLLVLCLTSGPALGQLLSSQASREADSAFFSRLMDVGNPAFDRILSRMTLEEKVGMLLMTRLSTETVEPFLRDYHSGPVQALAAGRFTGRPPHMAAGDGPFPRARWIG
jgi:hypothetical protein